MIRTLIEYYRNNPLSLQVLTQILLISSLFAALAAAVQLYTDYREDITNLEARLSDAERTGLPALTDALWRFDNLQMQLILNGFAKLPYVVHVSVESTQGEQYNTGVGAGGAGYQVRNYTLSQPMPDGAPLILGKLGLHLDKSRLYDSLLNKTLVILASQGVKTFSVSVFILLILHYTLMRHLTTLARFAEGLSLNNLAQDVEWKHRRAAPNDELERLHHAFEQMQHRLQLELEELEHSRKTSRKLQAAIDVSPAAITIMDNAGNAEYINQAFSELMNLDTTNCLARNWLEEIGGRLERDPSDLKACLHQGREWKTEVLWQKGDGEPGWFYVNLSLFRDEQGHPTHLLLIIEDITSLKSYERELLHHRQYDHLTRLPNRTLAMEEAGRRLERAAKSERHLAMLILSVDNYKTVAESLGIGYADLFLRCYAETLQRLPGPEPFIARSGDNEFLVLLSFSHSTADLEFYLKKLCAELARPVQLKDYPISTEAHIGVAITPNDGNEPEGLYRSALAAQKRAREGRKRYAFFQPEMGTSSFRSLRIASALRSVCERGELQLYYQPIVDTLNERVVSVEALVRWQHEELGWISPPEFISIAERTGDIIAIGQHILLEACHQAKRWATRNIDVDVAVNVSPVQFHTPDFVEQVSYCLMNSGLTAERLKLEITEQLLMDSSRDTLKKAHKLVAMGIRLAIDDFGTGYSSLSYLREFPFSFVKVDQAFVRHMHKNTNDCTLVRTVIDLAHNLDMKVVAEGVETEAHVDLLRSYGCDLLQGYYFSRPMPANSLFKNVLTSQVT